MSNYTLIKSGCPDLHCPGCLEGLEVYDERWAEDKGDDEDDVECPCCLKKFRIKPHTVTTYEITS